MQGIPQFVQVADKCGDAVGFLDFQALQTRETERKPQHGTRDYKCLCQVRLVDEIILKAFRGDGLFGQSDTWYSVVVAEEFRVHAYRFEQAVYGRISLGTVCEQAGQDDFRVFVGRQSHHFIPVGCRAPVVFYIIGCRTVRWRFHLDVSFVCPFRLCTEVFHQFQGQVDVGA